MKPARRSLRTFPGFRRVVATLRGPGGCPWDSAQTHRSLRPYLIEEAFETYETLDENDPEKLKEELGDLLFQFVIHVQIAEERGDFRLEDVLQTIGEKLVRRHPHVFGDATARTPAAVVEQWDDLKRAERGDRSALTGIPTALPGLAYAQAVQRRASQAGFAFDSVDQVWAALEEELGELRAADTPQRAREEIGDAFFALANLARFLEVDAEDALRSTCKGFGRLFGAVEEIVRQRGLDLQAAETSEKLALWEEARQLSRG